jgi:hypothetical protein
VAKSSAKAKPQQPKPKAPPDKTSGQADGKSAPPPHQPAEGQRTQFADLWCPQQGHATLRGPERVLVQAGTISPEQLEEAYAVQKAKPHLSVLGALVELKAIDELTGLKATADFFDLPFQRLSHEDVDADVFAMVPMEFIREKNVIPVRRGEKGILLGVSDPADIFLVENVGRRIRKPLELVVVPPADIAAVCEEMTASPSEQVDDFIKDISEDSVEVVDEKEEEVADLEKIAGESPVIRYVNFMISAAESTGSSSSSTPRRCRCTQPSSPASRSWRTWTSPSAACRRTERSAPRFTAAPWTSASARCPPPRARSA